MTEDQLEFCFNINNLIKDVNLNDIEICEVLSFLLNHHSPVE